MIVAVVFGCVCGLVWSAAQSVVHEPPAELAAEPAREPAAPVTLVLVASDGSPVSSSIDAISGSLGYSHCYLDVGHVLPDGRRMIVDYQPGAGVHYAHDDAYRERAQARIVLAGELGSEIWGCVRSRLGQPFNAAGALLGQSTMCTCSGLIYGCLPADVRGKLTTSGRPIAPNDLARVLGAELGRTTTYHRTVAGGRPRRVAPSSARRIDGREATT